jgi:hypothetical protein
VAEAVPKSDRVVLARDLSEFLVELSIALHKHAMYPPGHPTLGPAAERLAERAERLLAGRPTIAFGVARYQLIIDGVATDPNQPVLRRLAEDLHRHHLGAISILPGINADEIASALHTLAEDTDAEKGPLGLAPPGQLPDWPHLRLHPLTLDRLEIVSDEPPSSQGDGGNAAGRAAHLWVGLASAAMAADVSQKSQAARAEPAVVAKAIDEHRGTAAYDQVIVGYLLQIAEELRSASGEDLGALRRRTARLIAALRPETLQRLLAMGGNAAQRRTFVLGATSGMAVDSVIKIIQAAADASGQVISNGLVRMLSKLATHAEFGGEHVRPLADGALREQVDRLLSGWQLDDPNPDAYGKVLHHLATSSAMGANAKRSKRLEHEHDALRIVQMGLEVQGAGPLVDRAIDRALDTDIRAVHALLSSVPPASNATADAVKSKLLDPRTIARLVAREPLDTESLDELLPMMSIEAYEVLLDTLATSQSRTTRRKLLDRIAQTTLDVGPLIVARLDDERWYVQRNMLLLLERLQRIPPGFSASAWTEHPDDRVRHQAIHLQLMIPEEKELAVAAALEDTDGRTVRLGLLALQEECAPWFVPRVAIVAANPHAPEELRVHAVRALGRSREPVAIETLLRVVDGGRTVLGKPKLAGRTPVVLAALRALAVGWQADARARDVLSLALESSDPDLRQAAKAPRQ